jgi:hypothetical protein
MSCTFSVRPIYIKDEKKTAEQAIEQIHKQINAGQYEAIYDDAHDLFKKSGNMADLISAMKQIHEQTGEILQVKEHWINYVMGDHIPIRAIYNIRCEKGEFQEWIALIISEDGRNARLVQYQISVGYSPPPSNDMK